MQGVYPKAESYEIVCGISEAQPVCGGMKATLELSSFATGAPMLPVR